MDGQHANVDPDFRPGAIVDRERSACLCDVGAPGFTLAVAVTAEGDDTLWLVDDAELNAEYPKHGNRDQSHERIGPLPAGWRERVVRAASFRCGRLTKRKLPCRIPVAQVGDRCLFHRDKASAP